MQERQIHNLNKYLLQLGQSVIPVEKGILCNQPTTRSLVGHGETGVISEV